ncbi:hypothetical protein [Gemmobacter sp. 24YEA27]|uniref:hypothetical protein n=1 Tax=Gemmobacter sp. 24YEA27 TaxID=3040672 RepID=UPI0024B3C0F6|nr:hypothetical protein [Gemmobacter sp. 24YEA27]
MEQVLVRTGLASFSGHDPAFGDTGLTQLQIWAGSDGGRLFLFSVNDPTAAREWLKAQQALGHITSAEFIRTA